MSLSVAEELREFHRFVGAKLSDSEVPVSPEEALDEWRRLHAALGAANEDLAAIQESLDDLANGDRGVSFEEFDRDFRKRHNLPARS
jgi:hypothetical protein